MGFNSEHQKKHARDGEGDGVGDEAECGGGGGGVDGVGDEAECGRGSGVGSFVEGLFPTKFDVNHVSDLFICVPVCLTIKKLRATAHSPTSLSDMSGKNIKTLD